MRSVAARLLIAAPFILLVTAFTLSFDRMFADTLLRQHQAASLPSVVGTITRSAGLFAMSGALLLGAVAWFGVAGGSAEDRPPRPDSR